MDIASGSFSPGYVNGIDAAASCVAVIRSVALTIDP
jgi:hypothetical protein